MLKRLEVSDINLYYRIKRRQVNGYMTTYIDKYGVIYYDTDEADNYVRRKTGKQIIENEKKPIIKNI